MDVAKTGFLIAVKSGVVVPRGREEGGIYLQRRKVIFDKDYTPATSITVSTLCRIRARFKVSLKDKHHAPICAWGGVRLKTWGLIVVSSVPMGNYYVTLAWLRRYGVEPLLVHVARNRFQEKRRSQQEIVLRHIGISNVRFVVDDRLRGPHVAAGWTNRM